MKHKSIFTALMVWAGTVAATAQTTTTASPGTRPPALPALKQNITLTVKGTDFDGTPLDITLTGAGTSFGYTKMPADSRKEAVPRFYAELLEVKNGGYRFLCQVEASVPIVYAVKRVDEATGVIKPVTTYTYAPLGITTTLLLKPGVPFEVYKNGNEAITVTLTEGGQK